MAGEGAISLFRSSVFPAKFATMSTTRRFSLLGDSKIKHHLNSTNCRDSPLMSGCQQLPCGHLFLLSRVPEVREGRLQCCDALLPDQLLDQHWRGRGFGLVPCQPSSSLGSRGGLCYCHWADWDLLPCCSPYVLSDPTVVVWLAKKIVDLVVTNWMHVPFVWMVSKPKIRGCPNVGIGVGELVGAQLVTQPFSPKFWLLMGINRSCV